MSSQIIKADKLQLSDGLKTRRTVLKRSVADANQEAREILEEAKNYAENLRLEVEAEAEEIRVNAYQNGKESALSETLNLLLESREIREKTFVETEQDILRLSVKLAEKIIGQEIKTDKKVIAEIVSNALRNTKRQDKITVRVNPNDFSTVQEHFAMLSQSSRSSFVDIVPDPKVASGGCIIESEVGTVDARLETQLRALEKALLGQTERDENNE